MASKRKKKNNRKRHYLKRDRERKNLARQFNKNYLQECADLVKALKTVAEASKWNVQRVAENIRNSMEKELEVVAIDTETTGLDSTEDEILQVSIIGASGAVLYNKYFKPQRHETWEEAEKVNHISPKSLIGCPNISTEITHISNILSSAEKIVGYNTPFDLAFLRAAGVQIPESAKIVDVMQMFTEIKGEPEKWHKLTECAEYYGYKWEGAAHDSTADAKATLHCYKNIIGKNIGKTKQL